MAQSPALKAVLCDSSRWSKVRLLIRLQHLPPSSASTTAPRQPGHVAVIVFVVGLEQQVLFEALADDTAIARGHKALKTEKLC